uniref:Uncharacterized protein n=1 Tax=Arundo donax TaxID=35708 RepID=A0A0A9BD66_ARUDO
MMQLPFLVYKSSLTAREHADFVFILKPHRSFADHLRHKYQYSSQL